VPVDPRLGDGKVAIFAPYYVEQVVVVTDPALDRR